MGPISYIIGQIFGIFSTIAIIIVPLYKKKWQMLVNAILINLLMGLNYVLIGEIGSAAFLCGVAVIQCCVSMWHTLKETSPSKAETILFFLLYLGLGFFGMFTSPAFVPELSWRNVLELFPIAGALMSMSFVFVRDEQRARWYLLFTSLIWAVYAAAVVSTTFFAELFSIISSTAAIIKYRKRAEN